MTHLRIYQYLTTYFVYFHVAALHSVTDLLYHRVRNGNKLEGSSIEMILDKRIKEIDLKRVRGFAINDDVILKVAQKCPVRIDVSFYCKQIEP